MPWSHEPNQGFLRCLHALSLAADEIGEADEAARCAQFLRDCDPAAADALARLTLDGSAPAGPCLQPFGDRGGDLQPGVAGGRRTAAP